MPRKPKTSGLPQYPRPTPTSSVQAPSGRQQAVQVAAGKPQGQRQQLEQAQQVMPLPQDRLMQSALSYNPVQTPMHAPTEQPQEHVMSGVPVGQGPGVEALKIMPAGDDVGLIARAMYRELPNDDLRGIIQELELEGR